MQQRKQCSSRKVGEGAGADLLPHFDSNLEGLKPGLFQQLLQPGLQMAQFSRYGGIGGKQGPAFFVYRAGLHKSGQRAGQAMLDQLHPPI